MRAIVMSGGFGTRMRPLTCNIPKPMLPMGNRPVMEHGLKLLRKHGFRDVSVLLYYQPQMIREHFGQGDAFGLRLSYIRPDTDLGTAGSVRLAWEEAGRPQEVLVLSGDVLTDFDLAKVLAFHQKRSAPATVVLTRVTNPLPFGVVITADDGRVVRFLEKPSWGEVFSDTVNTGIYVLSPPALSLIPEGREFDFSKDLFPLLMGRGIPVYGCTVSGYWRDIGNLSDYRQAQADVLNGELDLDVQGKRIGRKEVWIGEGSRVDRTARLRQSVIVGKDCEIRARANISNSIIGDGCVIGEGAVIADSVIWNNVQIGAEAELNEDIIASSSKLGWKVFLAEGVVVSDHCRIGDGAIVKADVKLWPHKIVEEGATLSTSLVWGERWSRSLFGAHGVTGLTNVEVTPEFAARLGAAFGATLDEGAAIVVSRDGHRSSRLIGRALMAGALSTGVSVNDLQTVPIPVGRFAIGSTGGQGGWYVRRSPFDQRVTDIKFFDAGGMDLSGGKEKGVEALFYREDFRRAGADATGEITFPQRVIEYYKEGLLATVDSELLRKSKPKIVVDYAYGSAATIFPAILGELGCDVVSLNAYLDNTKITFSAEEFSAALRRLSTIVSTLGASLGVLMDSGGEKVFLVDEKGKILSGDEALATVILLGLKSGQVRSLAVPVSASQGVEEIAAKFGGRVARTRTAYRSMMETAASGGIDMLGEGKGGFIFPKFHPALDAQCAVVKILEFLARSGEPLSETLRATPSYSMVREHVPCQWELKGVIMRHLIEATKEDQVELLDGVKIVQNGSWVIVLPDGDRPFFHVNAEAATEREARRLTQRYADMIRSWQD